MKENLNTISNSEDPAANNLYIEYMSEIILQLPNSEKFTLLTGTSDGQASFYFQNADLEVNSKLYNNFICQRVIGGSEPFGVPLADLSGEVFANSYLSLYTKLNYQLSLFDQGVQEQTNRDVGSTVSELTPIWNNWVTEHPEENIQSLSYLSTNVALIEMTDVLNSKWISADYIEIVKEDPAFPYEHLDLFTTIYGLIPSSVSEEMICLMKKIFDLSGQGGAITSKQANGVHTILGVIANVVRPIDGPDGNGAVALTGSDQLVPGILFNPPDPEEIIDQLSYQPEVSYSSSASSVDKVSNDIIAVRIGNSPTQRLPILDYLTFITNIGDKSSIFLESWAGSSYTITATIINPVINPITNTTPLEWDGHTNFGWFNADPVTEAIENGYPASADVTGYVFNSQTEFDFTDGGNFGYINAFVFSQFIQLNIEMYDCDVNQVKSYFGDHKASALSFCGVVLNELNDPDIAVSFTKESASSVEVHLKIELPAYIPPTPGDIEESLCQLVAVEVVYPFS